jgi:hypothetical protein
VGKRRDGARLQHHPLAAVSGTTSPGTEPHATRDHRSLSPERMATYVQASGGDRERALRLYTWNTAVSAAFYGPLQGLEVAMRNAMHVQLTSAYGPTWYDNPACGFDAGTLDRLDGAKRSLRKGGYAIDPPHLVAELSFGFWVSLLGKGGRGRAPDTRKKNYDRPCGERRFTRHSHMPD